MSNNAPEQHILAVAIATGMVRLTACVFAKIAYWEQIKGGVEIAGEVLRWRTARDIGAELGYSERSVTRALKALRETGMIHTRTIWSPTVVGTRVNGFRLGPRGIAVLQQARSAWQEGRSRKRQTGSSETDRASASNTPPRRAQDRQSVRFKYSEQVQDTMMELITLPPPARENIFPYLDDERLQEEELENLFLDYTQSVKDGEDIASQAEKFWVNLSDAAIELVDVQMEPFTHVVGQRIENYLSYFVEKGGRKFGPLDPPALALWALLDPLRFPRLVEAATGKAPAVEGISSYQLGFQGYVLTNKVVANMKFMQTHACSEKSCSDFLNQNIE